MTVVVKIDSTLLLRTVGIKVNASGKIKPVGILLDVDEGQMLDGRKLRLHRPISMEEQ